MELNERKKAILSAIIRSYINTGEPIGSKALCNILNFNVSSATLRNEMSELCEMGYLEQPHTSAGRIPTNSGYKLYVDSLMNRNSITPQMRMAIDALLSEASHDPENLASLAGQILSDLTGLPSLLATISNQSAYVRRVELLPMGRRTILIVLVTSDGMARSRISRNYTDLTADLIAIFDRLVSARVVGTELVNFSQGFLQTLVAEAGQYALALTPLMTSVFEIISDINSRGISLKGESNLISCYENENQAKAILNLIARQNVLMDILAGVSLPIDIVFGDGTGIDELRPSNMVVARYRLGENDLGRIGVIGPTRMAYEQVVPGLEYFAKRLGKIMTQTMHDLED
ncbi:MAG: heat-inducible transcriptional repressor HrcA [Oscillospiraceae bacterium]|nr:heat-inducible transcriptional repressor HrcA [Oscillospiraceae bacterium]